MHDWKELVRVRLAPLPLESARRAEIIEELSQQLEDAYKEALLGGASEPEAVRRSLAQFNDWEGLRKDVFRAVKAEELPVWQQRGILSPKRPWVWAALLLSLALLGLFGFRQALVTLSVPIAPDVWQDRIFSTRTLREIERQGIAERDARALAFVALHHPDMNEAQSAAEKAIALDSRLTWISARFASAYPPKNDPAPWIARLKAWDPDNAFPFLLEAGASFSKSPFSAIWPGLRLQELRHALVSESGFRRPMQKAFSAPNYDSYAAQSFELNRAVLQHQGRDRPDLLMFSLASRPIPNLLATKTYAEYLLNDLGESSEKAGRTEEAVAQYQTAGQFGVRMQRASTDIERLIAIAIRKESYEHLLPLLRHQGRTEEAALLEAELADLEDTLVLAREHRSEEGVASRAALLVWISGIAVFLFGLAALAWLGSVILLRWKENTSSLLSHFASLAGLAPPLLLFASLSLYAAYYPYVRHINQFRSEGQLARDVGPFWERISLLRTPLLTHGSWVNIMIWPTVWCVVVAVIGTITLRWVASRRERHGFAEE
ncbi:MAG TPA: hypothetical protein VMR90_05995 [Candidatus Cybelea sp.]|nr:hypothetical protein [Candidatus Cybelea sp.]